MWLYYFNVHGDEGELKNDIIVREIEEFRKAYNSDHTMIAIVKEMIKGKKYISVSKVEGDIYNRTLWLNDQDEMKAYDIIMDYERKQYFALKDRLERMEKRLGIKKKEVKSDV